MSKHRLSRNMQLKLRGREYVVEKRLPNGQIRIRDIVTDERSAMSEQELVEAVFESDAELLGHDRNQDVLQRRLKKTGVCDIACLKEDDSRKEEFDRRISYVRAAREFHGRNLEDACHQLGIVLQFGQRGKPWVRPSVERSYRTVATQLHHQLPGTTFSNIFEKGEYEPGKTAIITPDVLDELTHKWIADVYQMSPHRGIRDVPALRWEKGIAEWPPALPANNDYLMSSLATPKSVSFQLAGSNSIIFFTTTMTWHLCGEH